MNEDQPTTSPSHNNINGLVCNQNSESNPTQPGRIRTPNIESVFQNDLSFTCDSALNFEKKSLDLKNAKLTCLSKEPSLNISFPSKTSNYELVILRQPEEQHRARYLTEGSRGTVKDRTGQNHPTVKLLGYNKPATLQVFVGTDVGRLKPHGFYQACKVSHKNSTACVEKDIDGTTVLELPIEPAMEMTVVIDCVGILKLRNADVEQRIGIAKSKKKSTVARLVFRVNLPRHDSPTSFHTLQVSSTPIVCTQPAGVPEILKKSLSECSCRGGEEMFIIGKNFLKGTTVYFEEVLHDRVVWSREADIDQDFFQSTHLVCNVPSYHNVGVSRSVDVQVLVHSGGRISEPVPFTYLPCEMVSMEERRKMVGMEEKREMVSMEERLEHADASSQDQMSLKRSYASSDSEDNSCKSELTSSQMHADQPANINSPILNPSLSNQPIINSVVSPSVILLSNDFPSQPQNLHTSVSFETQATSHDSPFINSSLFNTSFNSQADSIVKLEESFVDEVPDKMTAKEEFSQDNESSMQVVKEEEAIWPEQAPLDESNITFAPTFKVDPFSPAQDASGSTGEEGSGSKGFLKEGGGPMDTADISSMHEFTNDITQCILNEPLFPILLNSSIEENSHVDRSPSPHKQQSRDEMKAKKQDLSIIISTPTESPLQYNGISSDAAITYNIQESLSELKSLAQQVGMHNEQENPSSTSDQHLNSNNVDYDFMYQASQAPHHLPAFQHHNQSLLTDSFIFTDAQLTIPTATTPATQIITLVPSTHPFTVNQISQSLNQSINQSLTPPFNASVSPETDNKRYKHHPITDFSVTTSDDYNLINPNQQPHTAILDSQKIPHLDKLQTSNVNNIMGNNSNININSNNNISNCNNNISNCNNNNINNNNNNINNNNTSDNATDLFIDQEPVKLYGGNNAGSMVVYIDQPDNFKNTPVSNNSAPPRDHSTILYQLLTTPNSTNSSLLPNLSADDVNRVLSMSREPS